MWLLMCALLAAVPPVPSSSANGVVVLPVANMYSKPDTNADVVSQAIYSTNISVLQDQRDWLRIQTPDQYTGWIQSSSVLRRGPYAASGRVAEVESLFASLYRERDITTHAPVVTIPFGARLEITAEPDGSSGRWLAARLPDGRSAWIQRGDVSFGPTKESIPEVIDWSKRFLGLPYLWGGTSTFGFDCSGLTQTLYRRLGYVIPRDADQQAAWSGLKPVGRDELQPGDLLYFGPKSGEITHTGMYIGAGQFINATPWRHPVVQIANLGDPHWTNLFVCARRLKDRGN
ncbi:MAG: NlpC/P60 family protein [Bryobacteraceae bacterium]